MPTTKLDWADELVVKKVARGNTSVTAENLRTQVTNQCNHNIHTWHQNDEPDVRERERKKELKRLIKLCQDDDVREEIVYKYAQKGIEVVSCYNNLGKIVSVKLPLGNAAWGDLLNTDGEHLPSCCGNISRIRDILQGALRDNGYCGMRELWEITILVKNHDFKKTSPIGKLIKLWDVVKADAHIQSVGSCGNLDDPKHALEQLYKCSNNIVWNQLFSNSDSDTKFCSNANSERALATLAVCVRTLYFKLQELSAGPITGWAIFNGEEIGETRSGIAMYRTEKMANEVCEMWNKNEEQSCSRKYVPRNYTVHKCKITIEHGLQKL